MKISLVLELLYRICGELPMKSFVAAFVFLALTPSAFSKTCGQYFAVEYLEALKGKPEELRSLKAQSIVGRSISLEELLSQYRSEELAKVEPQIQHIEALIRNLKKEVKGQGAMVNALHVERAKTADRVESLRARYNKFSKATGFFARLLNRKNISERTLKLKKLNEELKSQISALHGLHTESTLATSDQINLKEKTGFRIEDHKQKIEALKLEADLNAQGRLEDVQTEVLIHLKSAEKQALAVIQEYAKNWVLLNYKLLSKVDAARDILEERVCLAGQCSTFSSEIQMNFERVKKAFQIASKTQEQGLRAQYTYIPGKSLRDYIIEFSPDTLAANARYKKPTSNVIDGIIMQHARKIVVAKKSGFNGLQDVIDTLERFFEAADVVLSPSAQLKDMGVGVPESSRDQFQKTLAVARELLGAAESFKSRTFMTRNQYQQLVSQLASVLIEIQTLSAVLNNSEAQLKGLLDTETLTSQESQAVEEFLTVDFYATP